MKRLLRHIRHWWRIYDAINVRFLRRIAIFCYNKYHKICRHSWFSHRIDAFTGPTTLSNLMYNRLRVVELWRYNRRKSAVSRCWAYLEWRTFSSTCSTSPIIMKFYQHVRSIKKSILTKLQDKVISIDGIMTCKIIQHDVRTLWRYVSVKNVGIAFRLCILFELVASLRIFINWIVI